MNQLWKTRAKYRGQEPHDRHLSVESARGIRLSGATKLYDAPLGYTSSSETICPCSSQREDPTDPIEFESPPMLTSLLPGFRSIRSSFLSGALFLASLYVIFRGNSSSGLHVQASAQDILGLTPQMPLLLIAMACLLVGSLYITGLEGIVDRIHQKLALVELDARTSSRKQNFIRAFMPLSDTARFRLSVEAKHFFSQYGPGPSNSTSSEFTNSVLKDVLWMDGKLAGSALQGPYDQYRDEGELRLSIALLLPLGTYAACHAITLPLGWTVLALGTSIIVATIMANYGLYYYRRAQSFLAHHVADGTLLTPCMETTKRNSQNTCNKTRSNVVQ